MMRSSAQRDRCTRCSAAKKSACARAQPRPPRLRRYEDLYDPLLNQARARGSAPLRSCLACAHALAA